MKTSYFDQSKADDDDFMLTMAKDQGYVPQTCLLGGFVVMAEVNNGNDACSGCNCPRDKCQGRSRGQRL
jgi:hypothetical protein